MAAICVMHRQHNQQGWNVECHVASDPPASRSQLWKPSYGKPVKEAIPEGQRLAPGTRIRS